MTVRTQHCRCVALLAAGGSLLLPLALGAPADAVAKKKAKPRVIKAAPTTVPPIANGRPCATVGAGGTSGGTHFDCVKTLAGQQWWQPGTRANPFRLGTTVKVGDAVSGTWNVTVTGRIDNDTARVLGVDDRNALVDPARTITSVRMRIRYVGPAADNRVRFVAYDGTSRARPTIERWVNGQTTDDDCWVDETTAAGDDKICVFPFEVGADELPVLRLAVGPNGGSSVFMDTATAQPPLV